MTKSVTQVGNELRRQRRRQDQAADDQAQAAVDEYSVLGSFVVQGHGEAVVQIDFPVLFIQKPRFFSGSELLQETPLDDGNFPEISASLFSWVVDIRSPNQRFWVGAKIASRLRFDNPAAVQAARFEINWNVIGKALSNPVSGLDAAVEGVI